MSLARLELAGFKSFAKKSELLFRSNITAVVGPNGSGKSNVAEALRWVLGEQSIKSLRGKKGEDLIWGGSTAVPRMSRAGVTLVFDNAKKTFDVPFEEVSVTREVYRDGENVYLLNGAQARLRDVIELLSEVSLGASSHHIINQGEADRILSASPKERKAMIEDALGLRVYHWKIADAVRKLEKTEENMKEAQSLRREISGHMRFLKREADKMEKSKELRDALYNLYMVYLRDEVADIRRTREELILRREDPVREREEVEDRLLRLERDRASLAGDASYAALEEREREIEDMRRAQEEISRKLGRLEGMIELKEEVRRARPEEVAGVYDAFLVEGLIASLELKLAEAEHVHDADRLRGIIAELVHELEQFRSRASRAGAKEAQKTEELAALKNDRDEYSRKRDELEQKLTEALEARGKLKYEVGALVSQSRKKEQDYFAMRERKMELTAFIEHIEGDIENIRLREQALEREFSELRTLLGSEREQELRAHCNGVQGEPGESADGHARNHKEIERLKIRIEEIGPPNESLLEEYENIKHRDEFLERETADLTESAASLGSVIRELKEKLEEDFKKGITEINGQFQRYFELMFGGGKAYLKLERTARKREIDETFEDDETPEEGIDIRVSLPRKKIRGLEMLSGGERALTSIALLFAMTQVKPPPFLVLDETDAALDEANSRKYGDMLESLARETQLVVITHNRETMSRAGVLYGVTMGRDGISRLLSVKFEEAAQIAG